MHRWIRASTGFASEERSSALLCIRSAADSCSCSFDKPGLSGCQLKVTTEADSQVNTASPHRTNSAESDDLFGIFTQGAARLAARVFGTIHGQGHEHEHAGEHHGTQG